MNSYTAKMNIWPSSFLCCQVTILIYIVASNLQYKLHQIPNLKCFSSNLGVVYAQSIEARC